VEAQSSTQANSPASLNIPSDLYFLAPVVVGDLVRVGSANDGGYVIPLSLIEKSEIVVSFGLSDNWSFEEQFKKINPCVRIHAYDHTVSGSVFGLSLLRGILKLPFGKLPAGNLSRRWTLFSSYHRFFTKDSRHFRERVNSRPDIHRGATPSIAFQRARSDRIFLKVDIEGDEYQIINDLIKYVDRIDGLVIEFHQTGEKRSLFIESVRLLQLVYDIVHLHANNFGPVGVDDLPEALELTFAKKSNLDHHPKRDRLPLPTLDAPNNPCKPDFQITFAL
jgi:hypothetical protein